MAPFNKGGTYDKHTSCWTPDSRARYRRGVAALPNRAFAAPPPALPTCTQLPAELLGGNITYANAQIVPASSTPVMQAANFTGATPNEPTIPVAYCLVVLSYSSEKTAIQAQNITIYVGLPLNSTDGGVTGSTVDPPGTSRRCRATGTAAPRVSAAAFALATPTSPLPCRRLCRIGHRWRPWR